MPSSVASYNEWVKGNANIELVMVSYDQSEDVLKEWAKKENFPWPVILPKDNDTSVLRKNPPAFFPSMLIIDASGKKIAQGRSGAMWAKLKELGGN